MQKDLFGESQLEFANTNNRQLQVDDKAPQQAEVNGSKEGEPATAKQLKNKLIANDYRCALSGLRLSPETVNVDHIIPVSDGGSDSINNLQLLDSRINQMKGTLSQEEFIELCSRVTAWNR